MDFVGKPVKGATRSSLFTAQIWSRRRDEYLLALRSNSILKDSSFPWVSGGSTNLLEAARRRLLLSAAAAFSGEAKGHLEQLASAAESVDPRVPEGLDQVREAFGEVSQHLIALLSADPDLAKGRYVFECPMAKSYLKMGAAVGDGIESLYGTRDGDLWCGECVAAICRH